MDRVVIRLECLKLAHSHGIEPLRVLDRAKAYEAFVVGSPENPTQSVDQETPKPAKVGPGRPKKAGNPDILG